MKKRHISKKLFNAGIADKHQGKEGSVYKTGGFNDKSFMPNIRTESGGGGVLRLEFSDIFS